MTSTRGCATGRRVRVGDGQLRRRPQPQARTVLHHPSSVAHRRGRPRRSWRRPKPHHRQRRRQHQPRRRRRGHAAHRAAQSWTSTRASAMARSVWVDARRRRPRPPAHCAEQLRHNRDRSQDLSRRRRQRRRQHRQRQKLRRRRCGCVARRAAHSRTSTRASAMARSAWVDARRRRASRQRSRPRRRKLASDHALMASQRHVRSVHECDGCSRPCALRSRFAYYTNTCIHAACHAGRISWCQMAVRTRPRDGLCLVDKNDLVATQRSHVDRASARDGAGAETRARLSRTRHKSCCSARAVTVVWPRKALPVVDNFLLGT